MEPSAVATQSSAVAQSISATGDAASKITTAAGDAAAKVMDKIPDVLNKVIDTLSNKFGQTGEALWAILVKQQIVKGVQDVIEVVLLGSLFYFMWKVAYPWLYDYSLHLKKQPDNGYDPSPQTVARGFLLGFALLFSFIMILMFMSNLEECVGYFVNPQYSAIKDLMEMVRNVSGN